MTLGASGPDRAPQRARIVAAFAILYLVWGSTYLVIRVGVAELPPALFTGVRFLLAGFLLTIYARLRGQRFPAKARAWRNVAIVGFFLFVCANGLVVWAEQWVPSNEAALIVTSTALWLALLGTLGRNGQVLDRRTVIGLMLGFTGAALLLIPRGDWVPDAFFPRAALLVSGLAWAAGSIWWKRTSDHTGLLMAAGLQSLSAGVLLSAYGLIAGESTRWVWSAPGIGAIAYLVVFGSCFAYASYVYLLHAVRPALLGTYAYVNPLVAVVLGWLFLDETLVGLQWVGMLVILIGVVLVSLSPFSAPEIAADRGEIHT